MFLHWFKINNNFEYKIFSNLEGFFKKRNRLVMTSLFLVRDNRMSSCSQNLVMWIYNYKKITAREWRYPLRFRWDFLYRDKISTKYHYDMCFFVLIRFWKLKKSVVKNKTLAEKYISKSAVKLFRWLLFQFFWSWHKFEFFMSETHEVSSQMLNWFWLSIWSAIEF